jgi:hypothetical protein
VAFYVIYIQEAHASDAWQLKVNERENVVYEDPKTDEERAAVAGVCVRNLKIELPALLDDSQNSVERAYTGWPDRLYLIDRGGRIAYKSKPGPYGFKTNELKDALQNLQGKT